MRPTLSILVLALLGACAKRSPDYAYPEAAYDDYGEPWRTLGRRQTLGQLARSGPSRRAGRVRPERGAG